MKILFGQIIFVRKYYIALYTWHDHCAEVWGKEMKRSEERRVGKEREDRERGQIKWCHTLIFMPQRLS